MNDLRIAVMIPCYEEEATIGTVVQEFRQNLPNAAIYVYDNNSSDRTSDIAHQAGAEVRSEPLQGKGNVVRRMFADVEADIYILVDGDNTYDASVSPELIKILIENHVDMVNAARDTNISNAYRTGHRIGNTLLSGIVRIIFGDRINDMLSGYRVFSRRFVKSFPALSTGFEIETELTIHALELRLPILELQTHYKERPTGSTSKLRTIRDGIRILFTIIKMIRREKPLIFFSILFAVLAATSIGLAWPIFTEFIETGLVPRFPTAILAAGIMQLAFLALTAGIIMESITHSRREMRRLHYLSIPSYNVHLINYSKK
jgi:glycosyltransferase involved in cell wall biosynthesis